MEKKVPFSLSRAKEIIAEFPTPFHIYDEEGIRRTARALNDAFSWNPGYREYFAVKALPNPFIMKILQQEGCGADCSSYTELELADSVGYKTEEIMFSSNETPANEFEKARELGAIINLDDITHIDFLAKHGGIPEKICCRYNPGGDFFIGNTIMGNPGDAKYGMTKRQLFEAFAKLKTMGVKEFGLHAFLASNMTEQGYYPSLARTVFEIAAELHKTLDVKISFINLSGGIGIPYTTDGEPVDIKLVGEGVRKVYEDTILASGMDHVAIYTELGRYMTGPYGYLVTTVVHEKHIYKDYVGVDACACNLMRPAMYGAYHHLTVLGKENKPCDHKYDVVGSLCENNDKFAVDRMMPFTEPGDIIVIHDTGAHGFSMGYQYNGKLRSAELLLRPDGSVKLIRRAETPQDYFQTLDFAKGNYDV